MTDEPVVAHLLGGAVRPRRVLRLGRRRPGARGARGAAARLPAAARARPVRVARHLDHARSRSRSVGVRDPQPRSSSVRRAGPSTRGRSRAARSSPAPTRTRSSPRVLAPQGGVRARPRARRPRPRRARRAARRRDPRAARRACAASVTGRPTGSSRATSRGPTAWPAGDLALRKAVVRFYADDVDAVGAASIRSRTWQRTTC